MNYKRIPTSKEVYCAKMDRHYEDLSVFSSYSAPNGDYYGNPDVCRMMTEWGFKGADFPILGIETTWDRQPKGVYERVNEQHKYWLCVVVEEND